MTVTTTSDGGVAVETRPGFDEYVAARSGRLLRTAYLLTHDRDLAEDLLQTALAKAWFSWNRIEGNPEPYVRKVLVNTYASWWRRKWNDEQPADELPEREHVEDPVAGHDLWVALARDGRDEQWHLLLEHVQLQRRGTPESGSTFENGTRHSVGWSSVVVQPSDRPTTVELVVARGLTPTTQMALVTSSLVG